MLRMEQASVFSSSYLYIFIIFFSAVMRCSLKEVLRLSSSRSITNSSSWLGSVWMPSTVFMNSIVVYLVFYSISLITFLNCCWYY